MIDTSSDAGHPAVRWTFADMLLVLVFSLVGAVLVVLGIRLLAPVLGVGDMAGLVRDHPVVVSGVSGILIYGLILAGIYLIIVRRRGAGWSGVGFHRPPLLPLVLAPVIAVGQLIAIAITNLVLLSLIGEFENPQAAALTGGEGFTWSNFVLMLLLAGLVAPVVEEVLFRGIFYGWLRARLPLVAAIVVSAAIFAGAHVIPILLPALFVAGLILAVTYEWSGSLWTTIVIHAIQNSVAVVVIFAALALNLA